MTTLARKNISLLLPCFPTSTRYVSPDSYFRLPFKKKMALLCIRCLQTVGYVTPTLLFAFLLGGRIVLFPVSLSIPRSCRLCAVFPTALFLTLAMHVYLLRSQIRILQLTFLHLRFSLSTISLGALD